MNPEVSLLKLCVFLNSFNDIFVKREFFKKGKIL